MPKRNRHREKMKAEGFSSKPATPSPAKVPDHRPPSSGKPATAKATTQTPKPPKPRTPPLTPEQRKEKIRQRRLRHEAHLKARVPEVLAALRSRFPDAFPSDPARLRPWAIGFLDDIKKANLGFSTVLLRTALKRFTNVEAYQTVLAAGGPRYDLAGNPQGEVTPEQMQKAAALLEALRAKREKRAQEALAKQAQAGQEGQTAPVEQAGQAQQDKPPTE